MEGTTDVIDKANPTPLYYQLKRFLSKQIKEKVWLPGHRIPTEEELAKKYNLSRGTIRRAISDLVNEGLLYRRVSKGTFVTEPGRREFRAGLVILGMSGEVSLSHDIFFSRVVRGINSEMESLNCRLDLLFRESNPSRSQALQKVVEDGGFDGMLILTHEPIYWEDVDFLEEGAFPYVLMHRYLKDHEVNSVICDDYRGAVEAVKYLYSLGHRRLVCVGGNRLISTGWSKIEGFRAGVEECGLSFGEDMYRSFKGIEDIFDNPSPPTAVFLATDEKAPEFVGKLASMGLRIPDDVSVVGYDDEMSEVVNPPMTTFDSRSYDVGREAIKLLVKVIRGEPLESRRICLEPRMIIRQSCKRIG
jgi:GntR family transcriptional regulator of arabinose operon